MERYYYDQRRLPSRRSGGKALFPFLFLIVLGVMAVLGFSLFKSFFSGSGGQGVFAYVVSGQAQMKMWGTDEFSKVYSGMKILQGDELYTAKDSRVIAEFFDGVIVRIDGGTQVSFNEIYSDGKGTEVQLVLESGGIWVNKTALKAADTEFFVLTDNVLVKAVSSEAAAGSVFDVENSGGNEVVRVVYGAVEVDVYSEGGGTVVDHVAVPAGSQAIFDADKLGRFWKFQAPNVLSKFGAEFVELDWYAWNSREDEDPSEFEVEAAVEAEAEPEVMEADSAGTAADSAGMEADSDVLQGTEALPGVLPESLPESVGDAAEVSEETEILLDLGPLGTPEIMEVNGEEWSDSVVETGIVVVNEPVKVVGKVSGAEKVVVNGYQLERFEPKEGEETFVYWLKGEYANLLDGENVYEVYALDSEGLRSASVYFKVIYKPVAPVVDDVVTDGESND